MREAVRTDAGWDVYISCRRVQVQTLPLLPFSASCKCGPLEAAGDEGLGVCHPGGRPRLNFRLLGLAWLSHGCYRPLWRETTDGSPLPFEPNKV